MGGPYRTGDVELLVGLGEHVLRYWERELPILSPSRSPFGRREWSEADIALLLRVRHLVKDRGFGLSATMDALIAERSGSGADIAASLGEVRAALVGSYFESRALVDRLHVKLGANGSGPSKTSKTMEEIDALSIS